MKVILEEPNAHVFFNDKEGYIEIKIENEITLNEYQFTYNHALNYAKSEGIHYLLINESRAKDLDYKAKTWLAISFIPRLLNKLGFQLKIAFIRPKNQFTSLSGKAIDLAHKKLKTQFLMEFFQDEDQAIEWLNTREKLP